MVKCSRCGVEIADSFEICPNCGNDLTQSKEKPVSQSTDGLKCHICGELLKPDAEFCSKCGTKVEVDISNRCEGCGSEIPDDVLFCPTCGTKVKQKQAPQFKRCSNCGFQLEEEDAAFCPECGANIVTGKKADIPPVASETPNQSFADKININKIIKPTVVGLIVSIILSIIGVLIGLSWISFIIAIVLSMGFFGGLINNDANAIVSGFFVGLILGLLENPIIELCWGSLAARFYEWFYGGQILLLIILGIIVAYVSNKYFKSNIQDLAGKFASWL